MTRGAAPLFSVITPVYGPPLEVLEQTLDSVLAQTFADWELILVDDCSPDPRVRALLHRYAERDSRVRVIERATNGHIVAASNDGVDAARGTFIALLDHDDLLVPRALQRNAERIRAGERSGDEVDYLYSDEVHVNLKGLHQRFHKPVWSPERLRSQNYCCHLSVLRTSLVREVGAFRPGFEGSQDHDLILRVTERARRIVHIPEALYHWRAVEGSTAAGEDNKAYAAEAGRRAVQEHLDRTGVAGRVELVRGAPYRVRRTLPPERRVSIVIPTRGSEGVVWGRRSPMVVEAVRSALAKTSHENLEVVVVVDDPTPPAVIDQLRDVAGDRLVVARYREPFNYSRKMNLGVLVSTGDRLVLLNDDTSVRTSQWLDDLLGPLEEPDVAMTGAKLLYSSGAVQHAGIYAGRGVYSHAYRNSLSRQGSFGDLLVSREVSGVTGACVGMRREVFLELGGFYEDLWANFNDVDLCAKAWASGYRVIYLPGVQLFHFETMTRDPKVHAGEVRMIRERWGRPLRDRFMPSFPGMPLTLPERQQREQRKRRRKLGIEG